MLQTYSFVYFTSWGNIKTCIGTYSFVVISFVFPVGCNKYTHGGLLVASFLSPVFYEFCLTEGLAYYGNKLCLYVGTAVAQWLRCCATNRKVAGSIPGGVNGIFH